MRRQPQQQYLLIDGEIDIFFLILLHTKNEANDVSRDRSRSSDRYRVLHDIYCGDYQHELVTDLFVSREGHLLCLARPLIYMTYYCIQVCKSAAALQIMSLSVSKPVILSRVC